MTQSQAQTIIRTRFARLMIGAHPATIKSVAAAFRAGDLIVIRTSIPPWAGWMIEARESISKN